MLQTMGWLGWAKNEAAAGTVGLSKQAEAIQIKLVAKGSSDAPVQDHDALIQLPGLSAKANCSGLGWQAPVGNGSVAGTVGQNRAMEAMQLSLSDSSMSGGISYSAHVSNIGCSPLFQMGLHRELLAKDSKSRL